MQKLPKNLAKTSQKSGRQKSFMSKKLSGQNIGQKIFYENINTKTSKISKNFLTLPNILNKNKKL